MRVNKRDMVITIGGTDYSDDVSSWTFEVNPADSGFVSFKKARTGGGQKWTVKATAVQDTSTGSFWDQAWSNVGNIVPFVSAPHQGNGTAGASATKPTFTGYLLISYPQGTILGSDTDSATDAFGTIDVEWTVVDANGNPVAPTKRVS